MTVDTKDIQITRVGSEPGSLSLKVEVAPERVRAAQDKATRSYAKRARLPGFRKGHVPLGVVRKQFRDAIREAALRELIAESWRLALEQESLRPIADPRVRVLRFEEGTPLAFELDVDVKPELVLDRVGGFSLVRRVPAVTDEMVAAQLEQLRRDRAPWVPVAGGPPSRGQMVAVTLAPLEERDGEVTAGEAKPYQIVLGDGQALPDLEAQLLTFAPGETRDLTVRYPDDYPDERRRGATRRVRVTLHDIKRQELPDLDDRFAREVGDFESLRELEQAIREDLEADARREADAEVRRQLIDRLIEANRLVAPRPLVRRVLSGYAQLYRVGDDELERFAQELGPVAERQVLRDLILEHLAEREQLGATEAEVDARIAEIARRRNAEPGEVYTSLQKSGRLKEIERAVTEEKVFAFLLAQSTVQDA